MAGVLRPRYETPEQKAAEGRTAATVAAILGIVIERAKDDNGPFDFIAFNALGAPFELWEIKNRDIAFGHYSDYWISSTKLERLLEKAKAARAQAVLIVGFTDAIGRIEITDENVHGYMQSVEGRDDRDDALDKETVSHFRWNDFHKVSEKDRKPSPPAEIYKYM